MEVMMFSLLLNVLLIMPCTTVVVVEEGTTVMRPQVV
jgi:hypothetical protein